MIESFATAMEAALAGRDCTQIGRWAAWTVMAASLTELWSRLLLPADAAATRAAAADAEALRQSLVGRAQMRTAADWLERQPQLGREVFSRGMPTMRRPGRGADITDLLRACLVALRVPDEQAAAYRSPPPFWRVSDAIPHLRQLLGTLPASSPLMTFLPTIGGDEPDRPLRCRVAVSSTLIAGLELARDGALALAQGAAWAPIRVQQANHRDAGAPQDVPAV